MHYLLLGLVCRELLSKQGKREWRMEQRLFPDQERQRFFFQLLLKRESCKRRLKINESVLPFVRRGKTVYILSPVISWMTQRWNVSVKLNKKIKCFCFKNLHQGQSFSKEKVGGQCRNRNLSYDHLHLGIFNGTVSLFSVMKIRFSSGLRI